MKGLDLSEALFRTEFLPLLEREAPEALPHLAAGLVGEGSDCFGFDDAESRDHDWGPAFCLWLPAEQRELRPALEDTLKKLPASFGGYPLRPMVPRTRVGVFTVEEFYAMLIGRTDLPRRGTEWLDLPEPCLAAAANGAVFLDNAGAFSAFREGLLAHFPEDVRLWKLASCAGRAAQTGQYNYLRCMKRGDTVAAAAIVGYFLENIAGMTFLLNRRYRPFYKWTYRAVAELPTLGREVRAGMERVVAAAPGPEAFHAMEALSALLIAELQRQGLSSSRSDFLMEHCGELLGRIRDREVLARPLSLVIEK